jgi:DNA-binding GntR family transcriptional regulator
LAALRFSIRLTNEAKGGLADYDAHAKIYKAIRSGNPESASRACRELIREALALVVRSGKSRS